MRLGVGALLASVVGLAAPALAGAQDIDEEVACLEPAPAAASVSGVTDSGQPVTLTVTVLLDGVALDRGMAVFNRANDAYSPLATSLSASFESVSFSGDSAEGLIDQAKARFGGSRPAGADLVYVLTSKDIQAGGNTAVGGLADCIGGVRYPHRAFAVGEQFAYENLAFGPLTFYADATAKIAGHELGHLLGAHHHYANCAEAVRGTQEVEQVSPCTLMFNLVDFEALRFSTLEAAVIRGHAIDFASP